MGKIWSMYFVKYEITIQSPDQVESKTGPKNPDKEVQINPGSIPDQSVFKQRLRFVSVRFHFELCLLKCLLVDIQFKIGTFIRQTLNFYM